MTRTKYILPWGSRNITDARAAIVYLCVLHWRAAERCSPHLSTRLIAEKLNIHALMWPWKPPVCEIITRALNWLQRMLSRVRHPLVPGPTSSTHPSTLPHRRSLHRGGADTPFRSTPLYRSRAQPLPAPLLRHMECPLLRYPPKHLIARPQSLGGVPLP